MLVGRNGFTVVREVAAASITWSPFTVVQFEASANHRIVIVGCDISLQHNDPATQPVKFQWVEQSDWQNAGSLTTITPQKVNRGYTESFEMTTEFTTGGSGHEPATNTPVIVTLALHTQGFLPWRPVEPLIVESAKRVGLLYTGAVSPGYALGVTIYGLE